MRLVDLRPTNVDGQVDKEMKPYWGEGPEHSDADNIWDNRPPLHARPEEDLRLMRISQR